MLFVITSYSIHYTKLYDGFFIEASRMAVTEIGVNDGLKIGVPQEFFGEGIHPGVEKAVWDAIHKFESLGATWQEVSMPNIKYALASYYIIAMSEASSNLARFDGTRYGFRENGENWHAMVSKTRAEGNNFV